ncbi:hypothetical protein TBLA_0D01420 [Henningerozyma blattae CBS 6284]|uniref:Extracellular mutant protein 11 C-terminal domain-containing protein n=1 Tax=Henningerozyma blattae (strain ATCC 34711 / CBS 6284 / DSM 70876 / NBRC 10599 / NRRL Y-10934 / UCD 77-7) TaxID=1071380 RepID=I2H2P7_HENB6|nr:hypothetical protein TBLA_0D01420 [Tetrapisispora blattae CBS 6284]CCH60649.1 hypothetical protein TBLA_0D01420 [Tetrapisispora blattae CBS 6284]
MENSFDKFQSYADNFEIESQNEKNVSPNKNIVNENPLSLTSPNKLICRSPTNRYLKTNNNSNSNKKLDENHMVTKLDHQTTKEQRKKKIEQYLLNPGLVSQRSSNKNNIKYKKHNPNNNTSNVKFETLDEENNDIFNGKEEFEKSIPMQENKLIKKPNIKEKKKFNSNKNSPLKKTSSGDNHKNEETIQDQTINISPHKSPGPYNPIENLIYERLNESKMNEDIFVELTNDEDRKICHDISELNLMDWIKFSEEIMNENQMIINEIIQERINISLKFQVITNLINQRAMILNKQGKLIDKKVERVKNLSNEILRSL